MKAHQLKFGNEYRKVGFSRLMLSEAINCGKISKEKFKFHKSDIRAEQKKLIFTK